MSNNPSEKQNKILTFYSDYGYIQVNEENYLNNNLIVEYKSQTETFNGTIKKNNITNKIIVNLKGVHGTRQLHRIEVDIDTRISDLIIKLTIEEDLIQSKKKDYVKWDYGKQYRLIATGSKIRQLDPNRTFAEEIVKNQETILLLSPHTLRFSEELKGNNIYLEGAHNAYKSGSDDLQLVLSEQPYTNCVI
jgi:hypothetical protein